MICQSCKFQRHEHCDNYYTRKGITRDVPTETWCACQHSEGIVLDSTKCHHLTHVEDMTHCPSCGKDMTDDGDSEEASTS